MTQPERPLVRHTGRLIAALMVLCIGLAAGSVHVQAAADIMPEYAYGVIEQSRLKLPLLQSGVRLNQLNGETLTSPASDRLAQRALRALEEAQAQGDIPLTDVLYSFRRDQTCASVPLLADICRFNATTTGYRLYAFSISAGAIRTSITFPRAGFHQTEEGTWEHPNGDLYLEVSTPWSDQVAFHCLASPLGNGYKCDMNQDLGGNVRFGITVLTRQVPNRATLAEIATLTRDKIDDMLIR